MSLVYRGAFMTLSSGTGTKREWADRTGELKTDGQGKAELLVCSQKTNKPIQILDISLLTDPNQVSPFVLEKEEEAKFALALQFQAEEQFWVLIGTDSKDSLASWIDHLQKVIQASALAKKPRDPGLPTKAQSTPQLSRPRPGPSPKPNQPRPGPSPKPQAAQKASPRAAPPQQKVVVQQQNPPPRQLAASAPAGSAKDSAQFVQVINSAVEGIKARLISLAKVLVTATNQHDLLPYSTLLKTVKRELETVEQFSGYIEPKQAAGVDPLSKAKQVIIAGFTDINTTLAQLVAWASQPRPQNQLLLVAGVIKKIQETCKA